MPIWQDRPTGDGIWMVELRGISMAGTPIKQLVGWTFDMFPATGVYDTYERKGWKQRWYGPIPLDAVGANSDVTAEVHSRANLFVVNKLRDLCEGYAGVLPQEILKFADSLALPRGNQL